MPFWQQAQMHWCCCMRSGWYACQPCQAAPHCGSLMTDAIRAVHSYRQGCASPQHLSLVACCRSVHCEVLLNVQEGLALGAEAHCRSLHRTGHRPFSWYTSLGPPPAVLH